MKRICVFCGSSAGTPGKYEEAARQVGKTLAVRGLTLVYGGASVGLMGQVADAALASGGEVIGVITRALVGREVAHAGLADLRIVETMHERKMIMSDLADGFIALPGGIGTFEEFFEIVTWATLGIHCKPCGLLNVAGYYDGLTRFLDYSMAEGFIKEKYRRIIAVADDCERLLDDFARYQPPHVKRAMGPRET